MATVPLTEILIFSNQFASMIQSKLPLVTVLENLGKETLHKVLRETIEEMVHDLKHGVDLGASFEKFPKVFDTIYINLVKAGMMSGRLGSSLMQICEYLTKTDEIQRKVKGALSYPIFMLVAFFLVMNAMIFFILPRFEKMFSSFDKELPYLTQLLMQFGDYWRDNWWVVISGCVLVAVSFIIWISTPEGRLLWDTYKLRIPLAGKLWRLSSLSRFMRTLAVQLNNEVELLASLRLAGATCDNLHIETSIEDIADGIERGKGISQSFREKEVFSGIVLQMISAGEEAGRLDELLLSAAKYFESVLDNEIQRITGLINPILTVVIGLGVASMMIAVFLPVFEMGGAVG